MAFSANKGEEKVSFKSSSAKKILEYALWEQNVALENFWF